MIITIIITSIALRERNATQVQLFASSSQFWYRLSYSLTKVWLWLSGEQSETEISFAFTEDYISYIYIYKITNHFCNHQHHLNKHR